MWIVRATRHEQHSCSLVFFLSLEFVFSACWSNSHRTLVILPQILLNTITRMMDSGRCRQVNYGHYRSRARLLAHSPIGVT